MTPALWLTEIRGHHTHPVSPTPLKTGSRQGFNDELRMVSPDFPGFPPRISLRTCRDKSPDPIGAAQDVRLIERVERAWEVREERPAGLVDDRDHVEAGAPGGTAPAGEEVARRAHQPLLLGRADRLLRPAEGGGRARAHLDEDEQIPLLG